MEDLTKTDPVLSIELQLREVTTEQDLGETTAKMLLEEFKSHFELADEWAQEAKALVVTNETQLETMVKAGDLRKVVAKKRIDIEKMISLNIYKILHILLHK